MAEACSFRASKRDAPGSYGSLLCCNTSKSVSESLNRRLSGHLKTALYQLLTGELDETGHRLHVSPISFTTILVRLLSGSLMFSGCRNAYPGLDLVERRPVIAGIVGRRRVQGMNIFVMVDGASPAPLAFRPPSADNPAGGRYASVSD